MLKKYFPDLDEETIKARLHDFMQLYFHSGAWTRVNWMGRSLGKVPCDMIVQSELLYKIKPDTIVECGTGAAGSALFYYHCTLCGGKPAKVISVDIDANAGRKNELGITYVEGDCTDLAVFNKIKSMVSGVVFIVLDTDTRAPHVLKELQMYSELVTIGSYIIIDDTAVGKVFRPTAFPGPDEAVKEFLKTNDNFEVDTYCENQLLTFNQGGNLRRIK
jgi:cephalosporin hydroxylase